MFQLRQEPQAVRGPGHSGAEGEQGQGCPRGPSSPREQEYSDSVGRPCFCPQALGAVQFEKHRLLVVAWNEGRSHHWAAPGGLVSGDERVSRPASPSAMAGGGGGGDAQDLVTSGGPFTAVPSHPGRQGSCACGARQAESGQIHPLQPPPSARAHCGHGAGPEGCHRPQCCGVSLCPPAHGADACPPGVVCRLRALPSLSVSCAQM